MDSPSNNYDSEDELNRGFDNVVQAPVRHTNLGVSLMDSDGDSRSSFTVNMLEVDQLERQELLKLRQQQRDEEEDEREVISIDDDDTSENAESMEEEEDSDEQEGGALNEPLPPLYSVDVSPLTARRSQQLGVEEQVARVHLSENDVDHVARYSWMEQLALALTRAIGQLLDRYDKLDDRDRLYFTLGS